MATFKSTNKKNSCFYQFPQQSYKLEIIDTPHTIKMFFFYFPGAEKDASKSTVSN